MSDLELLEKCIKDLGRINVPMALLEQIGIPIFNVRQNLMAILDSIETQRKPAVDEEPETKIEPVAVPEETPAE